MPVQTVPYFRDHEGQRQLLGVAHRYIRNEDYEWEPNLTFYAHLRVLGYANGSKGVRAVRVIDDSTDTLYYVLLSEFMNVIQAGAVQGASLVGDWKVDKIGQAYTLKLAL